MTYGAKEKLLSSGQSLGIKDYATYRARFCMGPSHIQICDPHDIKGEEFLQPVFKLRFRSQQTAWTHEMRRSKQRGFHIIHLQKNWIF